MLCDVVYNHFGTGDNAVWLFDGWQRDSHPGGIYFYDVDRIGTPWGSRPDYGRGEVRQFLRYNALMWLQDSRFDGLRWDATNFIRNLGGDGDPGRDIPDGWGLMRWINDEIDVRQPWKISIAEDAEVLCPLSCVRTRSGNASSAKNLVLIIGMAITLTVHSRSNAIAVGTH